VLWRDHVFGKVKERLLRALLQLLTKERDGEVINSTVLAGVIQSFGIGGGTYAMVVLIVLLVKLGTINKNKPLDIYKEDFEEPFLHDTKEYYARESEAFIAANGVSSYMQKVVSDCFVGDVLFSAFPLPGKRSAR